MVPLKNFIRIVYNNHSRDQGELRSGWGFAAWINFNGSNFMFDTGADPEELMLNLEKLSLHPAHLDFVFISHMHNDHVGGLPAILKLKNNLPVYVPAGGLSRKKANYTEVSGFSEISSGIWSTGSITGIYKGKSVPEQSLVLLIDNRAWIITGCSHAGVVNITGKILSNFSGLNIILITGGFHLSSSGREVMKCSSDLKSKTCCLAPSHCITEEGINIFKKQWGSHFIELFLGDIYEITV